jgi:hypothetical protein
MFRALKRLFVALGFWAESATETQAIDEAVIQSGIRDQQAKAAAANKANGDLQTSIILLRNQIHEEEVRAAGLTAQLQLAAEQNNESEGAALAEQLDVLNHEIQTNKEQLVSLDAVYQQNLEIIANALREVQTLQQQFVALRAQVKSSQSLKGLAENLQNSISQLQGMSEAGQAIQRMKERAASGQGHFKATIDLASKMGANVASSQEQRASRGKALFAQFKAKGTLTNSEATPEPEAKPAERQKISES